MFTQSHAVIAMDLLTHIYVILSALFRCLLLVLFLLRMNLFDVLFFFLLVILIHRPGPRCIKLTINGKMDVNGNYHRILDADWL